MPAKSSWMVTGQATDQVINTQGGQTLVGVQIYFITGEGVEGSVFIPDTVYGNHKKVHDMIAHKADQLDTVAHMAEGFTP